MSDSRKRFEEWAKGERLDVSRVSERPNSSYVHFETYLAWGAWSARDSEVERLREALKGMLRKAVYLHTNLYYSEPWTHETDPEFVFARAVLSSQDKESE